MNGSLNDLSTGQLQRLVQGPAACFLADCERMGQHPNQNARGMWLVAVCRGLTSVEYGGYWWQTMLLNMTENPDPAWAQPVRRLSEGTRSAAMTATERDAGMLRYTIEAARKIRERLRADADRPSAGYAWMLWRASLATGLRIVDLRGAELSEGADVLRDRNGALLLDHLSTYAREECRRLAALRKRLCGAEGEATLYRAALQAWDRCAASIPQSERPALDSARHLTLAVWRKELDNPLLAVLLGEAEEDVLPWGQELHPASELELHRPPLPPQRAKAAAAGGYTLVEMAVVTVMAVVLTGIGLALAAGRVQLARQEMWVQNLVEAARATAAIPGRTRYTFDATAAERLISIGGYDGAKVRGSSAATQVGDLLAGVYIGRAVTANQANLADEIGNAVNIANCPADAIQVILYPDGLETDNPLYGVASEWVLGRLESAGFVGSVSANGVFCCLRED